MDNERLLATPSYSPTDPNDRPPATSRRDVMSTRDTSALTKTGAIRNTSDSQAVCRRNRIMSASFDPMPVHDARGYVRCTAYGNSLECIAEGHGRTTEHEDHKEIQWSSCS